MKKVLIFSLLLVTVGLVGPISTEAKTSSANSTEAIETQVYGQRRGRNWNRRRTRSVIRTRLVWLNGRRYRETYRITYRPNGRTRIQVISRVRLSGYRRY